MVSADGRFWPLFNGEIHNFLELKDELLRVGEGGDEILGGYGRFILPYLFDS